MHNSLLSEQLINPSHSIGHKSGQICVYYFGFIRKFQRAIGQTICKSNANFLSQVQGKLLKCFIKLFYYTKSDALNWLTWKIIDWKLFQENPAVEVSCSFVNKRS